MMSCGFFGVGGAPASDQFLNMSLGNDKQLQQMMKPSPLTSIMRGMFFLAQSYKKALCLSIAK